MRDVGNTLEVDDARIGARPGDDQFRLVLLCERFQSIIVDALGRRVKSVGDKVVVQPGEVHGAAVREVPALREGHTEYGIARLQERDVHGGVRLRAAVRLDIGVGGAEQFLRTLLCERLDDVHLFAPAVVAVPGIPFGVFIRQDTAGGEQNRFAHHVLGRDEFDPVFLPEILLFDGVSDFGIERFQSLYVLVNHRAVPSLSFFN